MEVEAKFVVPKERLRQLKAVNTLGEFKLGMPRLLAMRDTFFDTPDKLLQRERIILRVRMRSDGRAFVTLKTPTQLLGAIHRRAEVEARGRFQRTPHRLTTKELPRTVRTALADRVGAATLVPLFSIVQRREIRAVRRGRYVLGEWSLDRVEFRAGARRRTFYELEIELKHSGADTELDQIVELAAERWGLKPMPQSKFVRALDFMEPSK